MNKSVQSFMRKRTDYKVTMILFFIFFLVMSFLFVYPLVWAFFNSLKSAGEFFENSFSLPKEWMFTNYVKVFTDFRYKDYYYFEMLFNSLWMLVLRVSVNVMSSAFLAYAVSRYRFPGKELIYVLVIFANTIPIVGSGAASYKLLSAFKMIDNPLLIWLAWAGGFDFAFIVFYGAFKGISMSYSESAKIDGAGNFRILFKIIFPQAFPCIIAIAITQAVGIWNDFYTVMIYMRAYPNLAYGLYVFSSESNWVENSKPIYLAAVTISVIPVIVLYASNQKLILTNVTAGGLKG